MRILQELYSFCDFIRFTHGFMSQSKMPDKSKNKNDHEMLISSS